MATIYVDGVKKWRRVIAWPPVVGAPFDYGTWRGEVVSFGETHFGRVVNVGRVVTELEQREQSRLEIPW